MADTDPADRRAEKGNAMDTIADVVKLAITAEVKAKIFYQKASELIADGESQMVFIELTEMEDQHARRLVRIFGTELKTQGVDAQAFLAEQQERADQVLDVQEHDLLKTTDMRQVIEYATKLEVRARDTYRDLKERLEDERLRQVCEELAEEEQRHHDMLTALRINVDTPIDERPALD
jgi:rubrerythrin